MRLLLDTHVWLWYLFNDKRLRRAHRREIEDPRNDLLLSSVSIWEAHMLIERGRLLVEGRPADWLRQALRILPVREAAITFAVAVRSRLLETQHADPMDRFIAATAIELDAALVTCDPQLLACPGLRFVR